MKSLPRWSVENPLLVNLVMMAMLVGGVWGGLTLIREMFPESRADEISITTPYPGATPAEIEKGISIKIEEQVKDVDGVEEVQTTIREGLSSIQLNLFHDVEDPDKVVTEVKNAIDTIPRDDFPEEAEETRVQRFEQSFPVITVAVYGDVSEEQLKKAGKKTRDDILAIPGITKATLSGMRRDEISVEIRPEELIRHGLSFQELADAISRANLDLPGGELKSGHAEVSVRTLGEKDQADAIGRIIVRSDYGGQVVRVEDVADVLDGFEDIDLIARFNGQSAVSIIVSKTPSQDSIEISKKIRALVAGKTRRPIPDDLRGMAADLPATWKEVVGAERLKSDVERTYEAAYDNPLMGGVSIETHSNYARYIEGRLDLLKRNGFWGIILVFVSLLLFLNWRVALWVMMGLLLAILGTLFAMKIGGISLNLITMFGLIIVLGMLVDDAVIVAENIYTKIEDGVEPHLAAVNGAQEVSVPVICAIATSVAAFLPMMFIEGMMGDYFGILPVIVCLALAVSLFESLAILPSHLAEWLKPIPKKKDPDSHQASLVKNRLSLRHRFRDLQEHLLKVVIIGNYKKLLRVAVMHRYVTFSIATAALIVSIGLIAGGRVPFVFIQKMDSDLLIAQLRMPVGTAIDRTVDAVQEIESAALDVEEMTTVSSFVGMELDFDHGDFSISANKATVMMELVEGEYRDRTSDNILRQLRDRTGLIPGVNSLAYSSMDGGPGGNAIEIEVTGDDLDQLASAANELKNQLGSYPGVYDIGDNFDAGRREIQIELLDSARALGLTTQSLATQVRAAFYGLEARKVNRDREDVKIMVRYPESSRRQVYDIESMRIAAPDGELVPFTQVAKLTDGTGYAVIRRSDQHRAVTVTADVDEDVANAEQIRKEMGAKFSSIQREHPGVRLRFTGQKLEMAKSMYSLIRDFAVALLLIYTILTALFKSYIQPVIVMAAIPFGMVGAVFGHLVMGYPFTILSAIGLVALTGIVVNDSLILIDFINRRVKDGEPILEAVIHGGLSRIRAIMLTSITTILGLAPLIMETSFQAKFLIPMGISIAFGLMFSTVLTLVVVPAIYMIVNDFKTLATKSKEWAGGLILGPAT
jgi:multidrug efflux pump subunit AcrB